MINQIGSFMNEMLTTGLTRFAGRLDQLVGFFANLCTDYRRTTLQQLRRVGPRGAGRGTLSQGLHQS